jgi:hypothetical protein
MTITATSVIHGWSTQATSNSYLFGAAVPAGDTLVIGVQNVGTGANIVSVADDAGGGGNANVYTVLQQSNNSANGNDTALIICNVTTALTTSNNLVITSGAASSFGQVVRATDLNADLTASSSSLTAKSSSNTQTVSFTTSTATAVAWAFNQLFTSATAGATYTDGHFTETTTNPTRSTHSDAAQDGFAAPGAAGSYSATCSWTSTTTGYAGVVVLDTAPPTSLSITGKRGAIASGFSRYGAVTTADATILALTGKKTAQAAAHGRFGEFTNEYLNFGGVAFADARFGDLSSAAALTAITGVKGAHAVGFSRFGALTTNTRGNLRLAGTRTAIAFADSRFGLISLIGLDITGSKTASALADARFGSLLLHNRTPGLVTLRAEQVGLVTIRTGV